MGVKTGTGERGASTITKKLTILDKELCNRAAGLVVHTHWYTKEKTICETPTREEGSQPTQPNLTQAKRNYSTTPHEQHSDNPMTYNGSAGWRGRESTTLVSPQKHRTYVHKCCPSTSNTEGGSAPCVVYRTSASVNWWCYPCFRT